MTNTRVLTPDDVAAALSVSRSHAYKLIRRLNAELQREGRLTVPGKVSRDYFCSRYGITLGEVRDGGLQG